MDPANGMELGSKYDLEGGSKADEEPTGVSSHRRMSEFTAVSFVSPTVDVESNFFVQRKLQRAIGDFEAQKYTQLNARDYYDHQLAFARKIYSYRTLANLTPDARISNDDAQQQASSYKKLVDLACSMSFWANVGLLFIKIVAVSLTGSVAVLVSTVDSALDVLVGFVLYVAQQFMDKRNGDFYNFPLGAAAAESVGIVVFATLEVIFALELGCYATYDIVTTVLSSSVHVLPLDWLSLSFILLTIVVKGALIVLFLILKSADPIADAYYQDHVNDIVSNFFAVIAVLLAHYFRDAWVVDPATGLLFALYLARNWYITGVEHSQLLICQTAPPELLQEITYIAATFHPLVQQVDTVRAFHFGSKFIVEVDIVLPPTTEHQVSHDVGDELQQLLEHLPNVLRAYVHLDWESAHKPEYARAYATNTKKIC